MANTKRKIETKQQQAIVWKLQVLQDARRAVHYTPGLTLNQLVNQAVLREVKRIERQRRKRFPRKKVALSRGRHVKLD